MHVDVHGYRTFSRTFDVKTPYESLNSLRRRAKNSRLELLHGIEQLIMGLVSFLMENGIITVCAYYNVKK